MTGFSTLRTVAASTCGNVGGSSLDLTYAIGNNLVPLDQVVVNITHYPTIAYTHGSLH